MNLKRILIVIVFIIALVIGGFFYFRYQVYYSHGINLETKIFEIEKGQGNARVAEELEKEGLISGKYYFYYYIRSAGLLNRIMPGDYQLSGSMTIPEIVHVITNPEERFVKVTFPEGFTAAQMAERLTSKGLPGNDFLSLVKNPGELKKRYSYLSGEKIVTLEGYLFPDTYFFKSDVDAKNIVGRLLDTFDGRLTGELQKEIAKQGKTVADIVIMASIVEREVQNSADMKTAAGIFWKRLENGQRLQSDAPLSYILNDNDDQHSGKDLELDSPYNTYRYAGLPPGPISNPGLAAITAAVYPQLSDYNFFLTATVNGEKIVVYSRTYEEHLANKNKYGL